MRRLHVVREPAWGKLCGDIDPATGASCLLADGHYQLRHTRHRSMVYGDGRRLVRWGPGVDNMHDHDGAA
jgi:hypothetical protein